MRRIASVAALAAAPAASQPTYEPTGRIARIVAETIQAVDAPVIEIAEVVAADCTSGGRGEVFDIVLPRATIIREAPGERSNRLAPFAETGRGE